MRYTILFVTLLISVTQYAESSAIGKEVTNTNVYDDARGIQDILENVQAGIQAAWKVIQDLIQNNQDRIDELLEELKNRAEEIIQKVKEHLENIKDKLEEIKSQTVKYAESSAIGKEVTNTNVYDDSRGIQDILEKLKAAWNAIKDLIQNNQDKIDELLEELKNRAEELLQKVREHLENIKEKLEEIIPQIVETGLQAKQCVKEQRDELETIVNSILENTVQCVRENVNKLATIENRQFILKNTIYETDFIDQVDKQFAACAADKENAFVCFQAVSNQALAKTEALQGQVLSTSIEVRRTIGEILSSIAACTAQGITESSSALAHQANQIIDCVKN